MRWGVITANLRQLGIRGVVMLLFQLFGVVEGGNQHQQSEIKKTRLLRNNATKKRETRAHELWGE
jgi:hypothetical protein